MNLTFIISVISLAIDIYFWLIVARIILSFIRPRTYHPIIRFIYEITEPLLSLCRRLLRYCNEYRFFSSVGCYLSGSGESSAHITG